ncbi:sugar transferase [Parablastomonas sp. CN1-191]|uniref:sugar transferase n=1 Tax=Parablastomonas sp. CN1-191 TaxID=3400908 RepID=UPI003BF7A57B
MPTTLAQSAAAPRKRRTARASVNEGLPQFRPLQRRRLQCYLALLVADLIVLVAGLGAVGFLYQGQPGLQNGLQVAQLIAPIFLTFALGNGTYSVDTLRDWLHGCARGLQALVIAAVVIVFIAFYTKSSSYFSRVIVSAGSLAVVFAMVWTKAQMRAFVDWRCGGNVVNEILISHGGSGLAFAGVPVVDASAHGLVPNIADPAALHRIGLLLRHVDRVMVDCRAELRQAWSIVLKGANIEGEVVDPVVVALGAQGARIVEGAGLLRVSVGPLGMRARTTKRLFDIAFAGGALIVLSPLLLATAAAILIEDGRPVLFVQRRVGRGNRFFDVFKFRSMRAVQSDHSGRRSAARDDDRVTRIGRLIRRTSIDELPQLFNVLGGSMSIVGPRPHATGSTAADKLFWEVDERYWMRHACKPGLTGLAQVRGHRGATHAESDLTDRLGADLEYLAHWSLKRDIGIILRTATVLLHRNAY